MDFNLLIKLILKRVGKTYFFQSVSLNLVYGECKKLSGMKFKPINPEKSTL